MVLTFVSGKTPGVEMGHVLWIFSRVCSPWTQIKIVLLGIVGSLLMALGVDLGHDISPLGVVLLTNFLPLSPILEICLYRLTVRTSGSGLVMPLVFSR